MTVYDYKNSASSLTTIAVSNVATSITVTPGDGALFAVDSGKQLKATLTNGTTYEIVHITARSTDTLTILRAQEGTVGVAWGVGAIIEARVTAGMLDILDPVKSTDGRTAVGENTTTSWPTTTAVGSSAAATGTGGTAVGATSTAVDAAAALGEGATATGSRSVAVGDTAVASAADSVVMGQAAASAVTNSVAVGAGASAGTTGQVVVGKGAAAGASSNAAVAVGHNSACTTTAGGVALGGGARVNKDYGIAVGYSSYSRARSSLSVGQTADTWCEGAETNLALPVLQRTDGYFWAQGQPNWLSARPVIISTPPVDLAVGAAWATTAYQDGDVVKPSVPTFTEQFFLLYNEATYNTTYNANNTITEVGAEPNWLVAIVEGQGGTVSAAVGGSHNWVYIDPEATIDIAVDNIGGFGGGQVMFFPRKAGFICTKYVTNSAAPVISIGNQSSLTSYVNGQSLSAITADNMVQWFELSSAVGATNVRFTLDTPGTGGTSRMVGRFVIEGVYMQLPG